MSDSSNPKYLAVMGMEIHAELATKSKMFCSCANDPFNSQPNTNICPVCLGMPGMLPTLNAEAIRMLVSLAADLESTVDSVTKWDRKNYFYPDLPKGYQISQFDQPLLRGGHIALSEHEDWPLERIHLEEDTAKLNHASDGSSLVDFNRSSVPLAELVTKPMVVALDAAPALAKRFCEAYQFLLQRRGISMADMEKGQMRCEANISVIEMIGQTNPLTETTKLQIADATLLRGIKVEVKNLNSFRAVERAVAFEIKRHIEAYERGDYLEAMRLETRGWDEVKQQTVSQRAKETSAEYRYFPEPDLPAINPREMFTAELAETKLPFPYQLRAQFVNDYGLSDRDAEYFSTNAQALADLSNVIDLAENDSAIVKTVASVRVNFETARSISASELVELAQLLNENKLPRHHLRTVIDAMAASGQSARDIIAEQNLSVETNDDAVGELIATLVSKEADAVTKYRSGKHEVLGYLIGQAMREAKGGFDPNAIRAALLKELNQ